MSAMAGTLMLLALFPAPILRQPDVVIHLDNRRSGHTISPPDKQNFRIMQKY